MLDLNAITYGLELEWADCPRSVEIPPEIAIWDDKETDVHNSDGHAIDPKGVTSVFGGEICTTPVDNKEQLRENLVWLVDNLKPGLTYRCFTHVHVAIPGLIDDIAAIHKIFDYSLKNMPDIIKHVSRVPTPSAEDYPDPDDLKAARRWKRQCEIWMNATAWDSRREEMLLATSYEEFFLAHFPIAGKSKRRLYHLPARHGINFRSLKKHGTLEFRFFAGSTDPDQIMRMVEFCEIVVLESLMPEPRTVMQILSERVWDFPPLMPFVPWQEKIFKETKHSH